MSDWIDIPDTGEPKRPVEIGQWNDIPEGVSAYAVPEPPKIFDPQKIDWSSIRKAQDGASALLVSEEMRQMLGISAVSGIALSGVTPPEQTHGIIKTLFSQGPAAAAKQWKGGLDWIGKQKEIDALSYLQALGDAAPETQKEIDALKAEQAKDPQANLVQNIVAGAGEEGAAGLRAGAMWLIGAMTWPARKGAQVLGFETKDRQAELLAKVGANLGLSQEHTTAITGHPLTGLIEATKESTAGITGPIYRTLVDQGVNPEIASGAAFALGGVLTTLNVLTAGRLGPVERIGEASFRAAVKALVNHGTLTTLAKLWGTRVATIGVEQATLGMVTATTNVLGQEWARQYSNLQGKQAEPWWDINAPPPAPTEIMNTGRIPATSFADLTKDILAQGTTQAIVGTLIGGITAAKELRPTYEMGMKLRTWVDDARAARASNVTAGQPAPKVPKALPLPETRAPVEEARTLLESHTPEPARIAETQTKLAAVVDAVAENPTPETIPHAIEAAKANDALEMAKMESLIPAKGATGEPLIIGAEEIPPTHEAFKAAIPTRDLQGETGYIYHATNIGRAQEIVSGGVTTHKPSEFTDQSSWPDGTIEKRSYWSRKAGVVWQFAPPEGDAVIIRTKEGPDFKRESTGDIYTKHTVPPGNVEILGADGIWYSISKLSQSGLAAPVQSRTTVASGALVPDAINPAVAQTVDDAALLPINEPWARSEIEARQDVREQAIEMRDAGDAVDAQDFAALMKAEELPGQEKPLAWYESQWDNAEKQRTSIDNARNDEFLNTLTRDDLQATLRGIADNPGAVVAKHLEPFVAKADLSETDFQSFVAGVAKNPGRWRKAIEMAMDPEARKIMQDRLAEGMASKVTRAAKTNDLLTQNADVRLGELNGPDQVKTAVAVNRLLKAAMKPPSAAINPDQRVAIEELQNNVSLDSGGKIRQLKDRLRTYYEQHPESPPDMNTAAFLNQRLAGDMKVKDLQALAEQIDVERMKGKGIRDIKLVKERKFIDDFKNRMMNDVQMGRGWKKNLDEPVIPPKGMEAFQKVRGAGSRQAKKALKGNVWQRQAANTLSPQRIFRFLGPAGERAWDLINAARTKEWQANDAILEPAVKKSKELGVTPRALARKVSAGGMDFTVDDILAMRWAYGDENSRETLIGGNMITPEEYQELIGQLRGPDKEWGDYMQNVFGKKNFQRLARAYVEETNRPPPPQVDRYFPIRIEDRQYDSPGSEIAEDMGARAGVRSAKPGKRFMIPRKNIKLEHRQRMRLGATSLFFEQVAKQEHYINTWETAKRLKKIFMLDARVREQIAQMFGDDWNKAIASAINAFANPNALKATLPGDAFANAARHALTSSGLLGNLVTVGYNLTGPMGYLGDAGPRYLLSALGQWMVNPKKVYEEVTTNVPLIKHASIDPVIQGLKHIAPNEYHSLMQLVEKVGYQPLEQVDMWTRVVGAKAVYDKGVDAGLSEKDAWNEALLATQRTQPSGDPADLPMMYQAASLKIFLAFTRQLNQIWNMYSADIPQEIKQGRFLQAIGDITAISLTGLAIAMMGQKDMPKDPVEAALWMLDQFVVGIPLIGNQLEPLLIGKGYHTGAEIIPGVSKIVGDIKALTAARKSVRERIDSAIRVAIDATRFMGGPAVALTRIYGMLHTGDPWELIGGPPRRR